MGRKVFKKTIFPALASYEEAKTLNFGVKVDRPYRSNVVVENYVKGTAATAQDLTATSDQLTIDKQKAILMYVDDVDKLQNKWDAARMWAEEAGERLAVAIDAEFLYETLNAANTIDDGDFSGTSGNGLTVSTSNISTLFGKINRKLDTQNVDMERKKRFIAISPQVWETLWAYLSGKETMFGDKTGEFGNMGRWAGLELFVTNNLTASAVWTPANQPSDGDTITISGVVFTFETGTLDAAGKVKSETDLNTTLAHLVAFINGGGAGNGAGGASADGYALSAADQRIVQNMVAVNGTTFVTVYHKGQSFLTVSGSDAADVWSKKIQHILAGVKGAIDLVIQQEPDVKMASTVASGKRGTNIMPMTVFGTKTFNQGTNEIVNVKVNSASF